MLVGPQRRFAVGQIANGICPDDRCRAFRSHVVEQSQIVPSDTNNRISLEVGSVIGEWATDSVA